MRQMVYAILCLLAPVLHAQDITLTDIADDDVNWGGTIRTNNATTSASVCDKRTGKTCTVAATWTFNTAPVLSGVTLTSLVLSSPTINFQMVWAPSNPALKSTFTATGFLQLGNALQASYGGTGVTSLTDGGILFGGGTGAVTASSVLTNGQLLIGDGTTAPTVATLTGVANETDITNGAGSITIGLVDPLIATKGGTGLSSTGSLGDILVSGGASNFTMRTMSGDATLNGTGVLTISASAVALGTDVTGTLPVANGGTGLTASPITVALGGTGATNLTANGLLLGNGTSALTALPAMGVLGMAIGQGTGVAPSTAALQGTSTEIKVATTSTGVVIGGAGKSSLSCLGTEALSPTISNGIVTAGTCFTPSGSGNANLASTQTWTGENIHQSDMSIGPSSHTTTEVLDYGRYQNGWTVVASTNPNASTSITFAGIQSAGQYWIQARLTAPTAAILVIRFNSDAGSNYRFANFSVNSSATSGINTSDSTTGITINANDTVRNSHVIVVNCFIEVNQGDTTIAVTDCNASYLRTTTANLVKEIGSGYYTGASAVSSVSVVATAGTYTGSIYLMRMLPVAGR